MIRITLMDEQGCGPQRKGFVTPINVTMLLVHLWTDLHEKCMTRMRLGSRNFWKD